jgi:hypothetical protein
VRLETRDSGLEDVFAALGRNWGPFFSSADAEELTLSVQATGEPLARPADWRPLLPKGRSDAAGALTFEGEGIRVRVDAARSQATVEGPCERYPLDAAVRVLLADALVRRGGLLLHGVAVAREGKAAVFTGHSGAGKSTLATWASRGGLTVLADELVAIVPSGGGLAVHGTPWNAGVNTSAALSMAGVLSHGPAARLKAVEASAVLRVLLSNVVEPVDTAQMRATLFQIASSMLNAVPTQELEFARAPDVAEVLREALK